jgi:hypothetical protein
MSRSREACDPQFGLPHLSPFCGALISKAPRPVKDSPPVRRLLPRTRSDRRQRRCRSVHKKARGSRAPPPEARDPLGDPGPSRAYAYEARPRYWQTAIESYFSGSIHFTPTLASTVSGLRLIPTLCVLIDHNMTQ